MIFQELQFLEPYKKCSVGYTQEVCCINDLLFIASEEQIVSDNMKIVSLNEKYLN